MSEYIEREKAINAVLSCFGVEDSIFSDATVMAIGFKLKDIPAADVQPVKHGRWINTMPIVECKSFYQVKCSVCESIEAYGNFCRNCGADMRGE